MTPLLTRLALRKSIGLHIGEGELTACQVASTPLGPIEVARCCRSFSQDDLPTALHEVLTELVGPLKKCRQPVAASIPAQRVFFSTRPIKAINNEASPEALLHEVLQSPTTNIEEMVIDLVQASPEKRPVASLVATRRKYFSSVLSAFEHCGVRPHRIEPAPCALLRAAAVRHRTPRKAKAVLRIFLGDKQGMAVSEVSKIPLVWRLVDVVPGEPTAPLIIATVRMLHSLGMLCGADSPFDAVMIHGRADLRAQVELDVLSEQLETRLIWHDGPGMDSQSIAYGVACGCLGAGEENFDLARALKPPPSFRDVFPLGQVVFQVVLLIVMALFLLDHSTNLSAAYNKVLSESAEHALLGNATDQNLLKEKADLLERVEAIHVFLATRVLWTSYTRDIPGRLPQSATLNSFQGLNDLEAIGKKKESVKPKKSFILRVGAPIFGGGAVPKDIDGFLDSLRGHPLLQHDFPSVELADIKWFQPFVGSRPTALFTIVCLPKAATPGGPHGGKKEESEKPAEH